MYCGLIAIEIRTTLNQYSNKKLKCSTVQNLSSSPKSSSLPVTSVRMLTVNV